MKILAPRIKLKNSYRKPSRHSLSRQVTDDVNRVFNDCSSVIHIKVKTSVKKTETRIVYSDYFDFIYLWILLRQL